MFFKIVIALYCIGLATKIFSIIDIGAYSITIEIIAIALMLVSLIFSGRKIAFKNAISVFIVLIIFQGLIVSLFYQLIDSSTFTAVFQMFLSLIIFLFFASFDSKNIDFFRSFITNFGVVIAIFAIYQVFARPYGLPFDYLEITNQQIGSIEGFQRTVEYGGGGNFEFLRVSSTFAEPGDFAKFMLICMSINFLRGTGFRIFLTQIFSTVGVIISQSIGGYFIVSALYALFFGLKRIVFFMFLLFLFFGLASLLAEGLLVFISRFDSIFTGSVFSASYRFIYISEALNRLESYAIFGAGIGNADLIFNQIIISSFWLNFAGEYGLFGITYFLVILGLMAVKANNSGENWLQVWLFVEFIALFWKPGLLYSSTLFALLGLIYATHKIKRNNKKIKNLL